MKWLATADVHLENKLFNIPELASDHFEAMEAFVRKAIELKVDAVVIAGDFYDSQRPMDKTVVFVNKLFEQLNQAKINVIGIAGDHDKALGDKTWIENVNRAVHPMNVPEFAGAHYVDFFNLQEFLEKMPASKKAVVEWFVFHGSSPIVFTYTEPKKILDFVRCRLDEFPKLRGAILGDLHSPLNFTLQQSAKSQVLQFEYCGSLGVTKSPEAFNKTGLLYWDGTKLSRVPFPPVRPFISVSLTSATPEIMVPELLAAVEANKGKKPVILVKYEQELKEKLRSLDSLQKVAFVRTSLIQEEAGKQELISIRSELSTQERIDAALKNSCEGNEKVYVLGTELLTTSDPKGTLDKFKATYFPNAQPQV